MKLATLEVWRFTISDVLHSSATTLVVVCRHLPLPDPCIPAWHASVAVEPCRLTWEQIVVTPLCSFVASSTLP